jgi:exonuclease III
MTPDVYKPVAKLCKNLTNISTWNINGFWSKIKQVENFVDSEKVAILALQETLVKTSHYAMRLEGYRIFRSNAEEDFRGIATLVEESLAAYEVPHGKNWIVHVKIFGYADWPGPTHIMNVYLKSGGNCR